jgi:hypothetical protein
MVVEPRVWLLLRGLPLRGLVPGVWLLLRV